MILVQISDTHVDVSNSLVYGRFNTNTALEKAVSVINAMDPLPDLVLHTGDIASRGNVERYERFLQIVDPLQVPIVLIPGNHDERGALRQVFSGTPMLPSNDEFLHYVIDSFPVRLICCDSVIADETPGELCPTRLSWLSDRLDDAGCSMHKKVIKIEGASTPHYLDTISGLVSGQMKCKRAGLTIVKLSTSGTLLAQVD